MAAADNKLMKVGLARAVIRRTISDLGSGDVTLYLDAKAHVARPDFERLCERVGYPAELLDTLRGLVSRSKAERRYLAARTLSILDAVWSHEPE